VRKPDGELLSVTQQDAAPLKIGQHVLIIEGAQARVVIDYTVPLEDKGDKGAVAKNPPADGSKPPPGPETPKEKPAAASDTDKVTSAPPPSPAAPPVQPRANDAPAAPTGETPSPPGG
jgi:hypothetical protein